MKKQQSIFTVKNIKHLNASVYGNPKKLLTLIDSDGNEYIAKTKTDAACGYYLDYYCINKQYLFSYYYTANGNMIIDYLYKNNDIEYKAFTTAGWREKYAINNGKQIYTTINNDRCIIYKYSNRLEYQDGNGATYNITTGKWIN